MPAYSIIGDARVTEFRFVSALSGCLMRRASSTDCKVGAGQRARPPGASSRVATVENSLEIARLETFVLLLVATTTAEFYTRRSDVATCDVSRPAALLLDPTYSTNLSK